MSFKSTSQRRAVMIMLGQSGTHRSRETADVADKKEATLVEVKRAKRRAVLAEYLKRMGASARSAPHREAKLPPKGRSSKQRRSAPATRSKRPYLSGPKGYV